MSRPAHDPGAVRPAEPQDASRAGGILGAGFSSDPVCRWMFASEPDRAIPAFFAALARAVMVPLGHTYLLGDSAIAWTPPDPPEWTEEQRAAMAEVIDRLPEEDRARMASFDDVVATHHPPQPFWYLSMIATRPQSQGRGLGRRLIEATLSLADGSGLPAYLESSNPRNVPLYRSYGFEVLAEVALAPGVVLTPMMRRARASSDDGGARMGA